MDAASLEAAFRHAFGALRVDGSIRDFYDFLDEDGFYADEDTPFVLGKALFREHIDFHLGQWSSFEWVPREPRFHVFGTTGLASCYFTLRGKPKGSGFRLRHGVCTVACHWDGARWLAGMVNIDALNGHIVNASPG